MLRTTIGDSVEDFMSLAARGLVTHREALNPSVACAESRDVREIHPPTGLTNPFRPASLE